MRATAAAVRLELGFQVVKGSVSMTSLKYRGGRAIDRWWTTMRRQGHRLGHGWPPGGGRGQRMLPEEEAKEGGRDRGGQPTMSGAAGANG
jgi:hypothetical protein